MSQSFRVMTFNVRGSIYPDGANTWPERAALNVATIQRHAPDLIGFQEVQYGNLETYAAHLTGYEVERGPHATKEGDDTQFQAIFWRRDRFERMATGGFYLSDTPEQWSLGWGANLVRAANWVRLTDRLTGHQLLHINAHLDHESHPARLNGAALIAERADRLRQPEGSAAPLPVILTGDFNDPVVVQPDMPAKPERVHSIFTARGYRDTYLDAGLTDGPTINTFHNFRGEEFKPLGLRIDWVLVLDGEPALRTESVAIVRDAEPPIYPSDHYPVLATLAWADGTAT